jgi:hypothetical protein
MVLGSMAVVCIGPSTRLLFVRACVVTSIVLYVWTAGPAQRDLRVARYQLPIEYRTDMDSRTQTAGPRQQDPNARTWRACPLDRAPYQRSLERELRAAGYWLLAEPTYRRTGRTHTDMWYALGFDGSSEGDCATEGLVVKWDLLAAVLALRVA